jgi:hypothetical protein
MLFMDFASVIFFDPELSSSKQVHSLDAFTLSGLYLNVIS